MAWSSEDYIGVLLIIIMVIAILFGDWGCGGGDYKP